MENLGYYNGKFGPLNEMSIPMNDRVHWFGDGVYDAGPARNYKIFAMEEHLDRFFNSARLTDINIPVSRDELRDLLNDLVKKVDSPEHFVYYQVTRGGMKPRSHDYEENVPGNLWIMIKPQVMPDGTERIKLRSEQDTRFFHCNVKTLNLLPAVMSSQAAKREGVAETVFYRKEMGNRVTECAHSNVSIILNNELWTAPTDNLILPGIARKHLIKAANKLGIPVHEEPYDLDTLRGAQEIIVTSSSNLCRFANEFEGKPFGGGAPEIAEALRVEVNREFAEATAL